MQWESNLILWQTCKFWRGTRNDHLSVSPAQFCTEKKMDLDVSLIWLLPAFILPCAAAWRLAKFNLDENQSLSFKGVPTPAVGLLVASLPLIYWYGTNETVIDLLRNKWLLYAIVFVLSYLMVSNLPMMSLKFKDYSFEK